MPDDGLNKIDHHFRQIDKHLQWVNEHFKKLQEYFLVPPSPESELVFRFFRGFVAPSGPEDESVVADRLRSQSVPKQSLGAVCYQLFAQSGEGPVFIESGSTTALAALALARLWAADRPDRSPEVLTNNLLVQLALHRHFPTRVLHGDQVLDLKYFGYFPLSAQELEAARRGDPDTMKRTKEAYDGLVERSRTFRLLIMTSSRFHFARGPFVGSALNALFKAALFTNGRTVHLLLDGTKLLLDRVALQQEYQRERCIQILDGPGNSPVQKRNPCVQLGYTGDQHFRTPASWGEAARAILKRPGELWVHVAEPDFHPGARTASWPDKGEFVTRLQAAVRDAKYELAETHEVTIASEGTTAVRFNTDDCEIIPPGQAHAGQPAREVIVRHFRYQLLARPA